MTEEKILDVPARATLPFLTEPAILASVSNFDLARTHFTFRNTGSGSVYSITDRSIRVEGQTMDFESIGELRAGISLTCQSIVHPVVGNDPHWTFDFWTASGEPLTAPFIVRYEDTEGNPLAAHGRLEFDGHKILLISASRLRGPNSGNFASCSWPHFV